MDFEGFAGCVRQRKRYQKSNQSETEILSNINRKSMKNLRSKKYTKHIENIQNGDEKGSLNPCKQKKRVLETDGKTNAI